MTNATELTPEEIERLKTVLTISKQNDNFRKSPIITEDMGKIVFTQAIESEGLDFFLEALEKIRSFEDFDPDIDPFGTHEMGKIEVQGKNVWFKIDLYNTDYTFAPEDPTDLAQTRRILTVLFPTDY